MYSPRHGVYVPNGLSEGDVSKMRWKVPAHGQDSTFNTFPVKIDNLAPEFESLAEMLKKGGYLSARLGKWHIGDDNQGFDVSSANGPEGFITNIQGKEDRFYSDTTVCEKLTDAAIDFIAKNKDRPFFLYLSHWEVHIPMAARKDRVTYYSEKKHRLFRTQDYNPVYAAEIEQLDISLGRVMNKLKELRLDNNTLLIFTSDNGGFLGETSNYPLRAGKTSFYEGGLRTPFAVKWPKVIKPGSESSVPISGIDLMPTFAEIANVSVPFHQPVDGISFLPVLKGDSVNTSRSIFFHFPLYKGGGKYSGHSFGILPVFGSQKNYWQAVPLTVIIKGDWKLIYYYEYDSYELFNLKNDISEKHNRASENFEIADELFDELNTWTKEVNAPVPTVLNDKFKLFRQE